MCGDGVRDSASENWGHISTFDILDTCFNRSRTEVLRCSRRSYRRSAADTALSSLIPAAAASSPQLQPADPLNPQWPGHGPR